MLKVISALALATATMAAPAFAKNSQSPAQTVNAPVAPVSKLGSGGLAGAYITGGAVVAGVAVIAILAGNDGDSTISTTSTTSTTPGG